MAFRLRIACNKRLRLGHVRAISIELTPITDSRHVRDQAMVIFKSRATRFDSGVTVSTFKFDVNPITW